MDKKIETKRQDNHSIEEKLRTIVGWSDEGPGQHNFLRIVADSVSRELEGFLKNNKYQVVYFDDLDKAGEKEKLQTLLNNAQGFMDYKTKDKIVVVVSKKARTQVDADQKTQAEWRSHSQHLISFGE
jgi:hypothetical protein